MMADVRVGSQLLTFRVDNSRHTTEPALDTYSRASADNSHQTARCRSDLRIGLQTLTSISWTPHRFNLPHHSRLG